MRTRFIRMAAKAKATFSVKSLQLIYPKPKEVAANTAVVAVTMCVGGAAMFFLDTLTTYLFAIS